MINPTATIQLKSWRWSDGQPVTSRDVQFWFNVLAANKNNWWDYTPGEFPDNVTAFKRPPVQRPKAINGSQAKPRLPVALIFACLVVVYVGLRYLWR